MVIRGRSAPRPAKRSGQPTPVGSFPGERAFYVTSDRISVGDRDLFVARRASADVPFDPPEHIAELASVDDDENPWVSDDERTMVFASGRGGALGLFVTTR